MGPATTPRPEGQEEGAESRLRQRTQAPPALGLAGSRWASAPDSVQPTLIPPTGPTPRAVRAQGVSAGQPPGAGVGGAEHGWMPGVRRGQGECAAACPHPAPGSGGGPEISPPHLKQVASPSCRCAACSSSLSTRLFPLSPHFESAVLIERQPLPNCPQSAENGAGGTCVLLGHRRGSRELGACRAARGGREWGAPANILQASLDQASVVSP